MQPAELGWGTHEKLDAGECRHARRRAAGGDLPEPARRQHARALLVPDARRRNTASWSPTTSRSRSPTISRSAKADTAVYRPTCHYAYHPANDAVLSLHELFGQAGRAAGGAPHPRRGGDRRRHRRARRAALRPRQATPTGTARSSPSRRRAASRPIRTPPACRSPRPCSPAWSGRWRTRRPGSSRPTRWISAAASKCSALSRAGHRLLHRLDAADGSPGLLPGGHRHRATPGSSATSWCGEGAGALFPSRGAGAPAHGGRGRCTTPDAPPVGCADHPHPRKRVAFDLARALSASGMNPRLRPSWPWPARSSAGRCRARCRRPASR